ncbi:MAG TPA: hypothetical protein VFP34_13650 [Microlunatus sp.]|nr:hypothetical protein [Microlunatus sp.]
MAIARAGAAAGSKEALFTLRDRPEDRWPAARQWLTERGYTLEYLRACAIAVLETTGSGAAPESGCAVVAGADQLKQWLRPWA